MLIAVGRAKFPLVDALTSRYVTFSLLFFACLLLTWTSGAGLARPGARRFSLRFAALILAVFVGGFPQLPRIAYAADIARDIGARIELVAARDALRAQVVVDVVALHRAVLD